MLLQLFFAHLSYFRILYLQIFHYNQQESQVQEFLVWLEILRLTFLFVLLVKSRLPLLQVQMDQQLHLYFLLHLQLLLLQVLQLQVLLLQVLQLQVLSLQVLQMLYSPLQVQQVLILLSLQLQPRLPMVQRLTFLLQFLLILPLLPLLILIFP